MLAQIVLQTSLLLILWSKFPLWSSGQEGPALFPSVTPSDSRGEGRDSSYVTLWSSGQEGPALFPSVTPSDSRGEGEIPVTLRYGLVVRREERGDPPGPSPFIIIICKK